ncbi:hypothetical protein Tco_1464101, partial [Tanacetum coccineum]
MSSSVVCLQCVRLQAKEIKLVLDAVLSWLLVGGYREVNVVLMKAIALLRLAIGSSVRRNDRTTSPESNYGNDACGDCKEASFDCCEAR